jgi:hypothetical protein
MQKKSPERPSRELYDRSNNFYVLEKSLFAELVIIPIICKECYHKDFS